MPKCAETARLKKAIGKGMVGEWPGMAKTVGRLENRFCRYGRSEKKFGKVPKTRALVAHARSATFPEHKGNIDYNEPYLSGDYCYVFNGMLKGVRLEAEGEIGAQKIWSLLQKELTTNEPFRALENISEMLRKNSRSIKGLNIALAKKDNFFVVCGKQGSGDYFTLRKLLNGDLEIICSEEIGNFKFEKMKEGEVIAL